MKRSKLFEVLIALAVMFLMAVPSLWAAQIISKVEDTSVALRVKNGYDTTLTIVIAGSGATDTTVSDGTTTNTLDTSGDVDEISELATAIEGCTNATGDAELTVNQEPSLAADSIDGQLLDGTYTAAAGKWLELLWDTSECKFYSLYFPSRTYQTGTSRYTLEHVNGLPGGTGDLTMYVYQDRTLIASKFYTLPVYVLTADYAVNAAVSAVSLDWELDFPFTGQDAVIVRATRGTTATTGVLTGVVPTK